MLNDIKEMTLFDNLEFVERLENLMEGYESADVEFKSANGGFPGSLWETYSAFANTQGGVIILGVKEKAGQFMVDNLSLEQIRHYKKILWDGLNNRSVCSVNLLKDSDVQDGEYNGVFVLVVNVPKASRNQRPVYVKGNTDNVFKRNHEGDYKCTADEIRRMYADADIEHPQDSKILPEFSIEDDLDKDSLEQFRRLAAANSPSHPWQLLGDKDFLIRLGGYRIDKREKIEGLTLAGMLMFGKTGSIQDVYCCPHYFPDYREYLAPDPNARWSNRVCPDGTWEANLFQFYIRVYNKLAAALPKPFALNSGQRIDDSPMHIALREAFINSLVHCDYTIDANITIEQHKDYLQFSNPGSLLISIAQYYQGGESVCRNKSLQQMFMYLGSAEKAGSGVDKILQGWKEANYRSPQLKETMKPDKVVLTLPLISLLSDDILYFLKENYGSSFENLSHDELMTLATCYSEGEVTNYRLQFSIDRHSADITKLLKELCNRNLLIPYGVGRGTRYRINEDYLAGMAAKVERKVERKVESLRQNILDACEEYQSLEYIASKVNKSSAYLNNKIIPKMLMDNLLERQYPDIPRHRNQKYRAVKNRMRKENL